MGRRKKSKAGNRQNNNNSNNDGSNPNTPTASSSTSTTTNGFTTPARPTQSNDNMATVYKTPMGAGGSSTPFPAVRAKAVDLVTGRAVSEYFFDPTLILDENTQSMATPFKTPKRQPVDGTDSILFSSKHLFVPCTIVKSLEGEDVGTVGVGKMEGRDDKAATGTTTPGVNNGGISGPALVKTSDGTLYKIQDAHQLLPLTSPDDYLGMPDVLHLANVSEASLLHTLRMRYRRDEIYTSAGPILISINPYKSITVGNGESLYSEKTMMKYRTSDRLLEAPHLFQVADRAYSAMMDSVHSVPHLEDDDVGHIIESPRKLGVSPGQVLNQSIIISGESGAGKTEATKYIMQYLARITKKKGKWTSDDTAPAPFLSPDGKVLAALEDRVLSSNPLLETFGNAQTLRNDNSSRFGKFIHINFSTKKGIIVGARISNYLLEKTRIATQIEGERNYHIFYQLFSGSSQDQLKEFGLADGAAAFRYLGNRSFAKNEKDAAEFTKTMQCLRNVGLATEEQKALLGVTAAVLHLGNVSFEENDNEEHSAVITEASRPCLVKACELLGLNEDNVIEAILTKNLSIGGKNIKKPSTVAMAEDKRDAFAKMTYSSLFLWLVNSINRTLTQHEMVHSSADKVGFIGVLDIYGFECFEINGYEQLLINYCNEKLQRHFNRHLFEVEQNLYSVEGVDWTYITFNDNRPCLELIEGGGGVVGILNTLDDSYAGMGSGTEKDVKFVAQLHKMFGSVAGAKKTNGGHEYFVTPKFGNDRQFIICHYAGEVRYTADGFVEKNMESLSNELKDLGSSSTIAFTKNVFGCGPNGDEQQQALARRSSIRGFSVASQFKLSLQSLVDDLEQTQPHYIRCIKPNLNKASSSFSSGEVLKQLRYSGMMEAIRIRREGYALREVHQNFFNRFSVLLGSDDLDGAVGIEQLVTVLSKRLNVTDADWQIGHTKIFLRRELSDKLERLARLYVHRAARIIGRFGRSVAQRRSSLLLVAWARFRLVMIRVHKAQRAASKIGSTYRMHAQSKAYKSTIGAAVKIQSQQRKIAARQIARKLRDPYCDLSYKDLRSILLKEKAQMEEAINAKDFQKAASIESEIEAMKIALEQRQPMTRGRLEEKIAASQADLDSAIQRKAYKEAGPLQDELEKLTSLRVEYPTLDELKADLVRAEEAVADAAKSRDFSSAASLQADVDKAKKRLESALLDQDDAGDDPETIDDSDYITLNVSIDGIESRAELEEEIASMHSKVEEAIARKNFKLASDLQSKVDEKEKLRSFFPSLEELENDLRAARDRLEVAISQKDFASAGKLHEEIDSLENKVQSEKAKEISSPRSTSDNEVAFLVGMDGAKVFFSSRFALEEDISAKKKAQSAAVSSKNFKQAQELQHYIDKLEGLRDKLPTVNELRMRINSRRIEMNQAVVEKRFGDAERIDQIVSRLDERLKAEEKNGPPKKPHSTATKMPVVYPGVSMSNSSDISIRSAPLVRPSVTPAKMSKPSTIVGGTPVSNGAFSPPSVLQSRESNDEVSDVTSVQSSKSEKKKKKQSKGKNKKKQSKAELGRLESHSEDRPVSNLRPKKPHVSSVNDSVLSVTQMLASKRGAASLVVDDVGALAGIVTDTDITRRLVARELDASATSVSKIMTSNPTCVSMTDSAMEAMITMVSNGFRHLPVTDDGGVVGLLDIAKCLNDAISKLEKSCSKNSSTAQNALKQAVESQGAQGTQAAALQALLGPLMAQAFGTTSSPPLRSLLAGKPSTIVSPQTSVLEAGMKMAESKKAALVVEDGKLVGIFGFKDLMCRVVAKQLPLESTEISSVLTPNPMAVSPDTTVLEALQIMHSEQFLTLPLAEEDDTVVGVVNVMDVIYGCGGSEGWSSLFRSSLEMDDLSDDASARSERAGTIAGSTSGLSKRSFEKTEARPVSKLRPKKPLIAAINDNVLSVAQMLARKRGDASIVVDDEGGLAGIVTDTDMTRRLVAKELDPSSTYVSQIMTTNPTCVSMMDSAMEAMATMVSNGFRHLPVTDENDGVVGLLDIAKCLNDAIRKLEKSQSKSVSAAQEALREVVASQGAQDTQAAAALHALLGPLMAQAFGETASPTLASLLAGTCSTIVSPETTVLEAGMKMAESRKAALVVEEGNLVGIFGFKDMMTRVVAKELPLDQTEVSSVMTPNPDFVPPEMTVLEALETMHAGKFLTLPVVANNGAVVGLVNVMDVIYGCGGEAGWRSLFNSTLEMDDLSDTSSVRSAATGPVVERNIFRQPAKEVSKKEEETTVAKLRPKKPIVSSVDDSILDVSKLLSSNRSDSAIIVGQNGTLSGIITDTDFTRRVVAKNIDPTTTLISDVMTPNPRSVDQEHPGIEAIAIMIENRFRHLPVLGDGQVVGVLDIARCLNDSISKLERSMSKKPNAAESLVKQALQGAGGEGTAALQALLQPLLAKTFGSDAGTTRTLGSILSGVPRTVVAPDTSVLDAATLMSENRKAALVVEDSELVGIFGFKDMMTRVIAQQLDPASTLIADVMTADPESVGPNMTAIDALRFMHENRFLTLPCCNDSGAVIGLLDVMDVIHAIGNAQTWRALFDAALQMDDVSDMNSANLSANQSKREFPTIRVGASSPPNIPGNIPSTLEFQEGANEEFDENTMNDTYRLETGSFLSDGNVVIFKIVEEDGHTHRVRSEPKILNLRNAIADKLNKGRKAQAMTFKYMDEEGDAILVSTDEDLVEAVNVARSSNPPAQGSKLIVKLIVEGGKGDLVASIDPMVLTGLGMTVAAVAVGAIMLLKPRR